MLISGQDRNLLVYPWDMDLIGGQVFLFVLFNLVAVLCSMWDLIP